MGAEKRRQTVAAIAAAALLTIGGVWFSAGFFRNAPREDLTAEIKHQSIQLPEITAEGLGKTEESRQDDTSSDKADTINDSSDSPREESSRDESSERDSSSSAESIGAKAADAQSSINDSDNVSSIETVSADSRAQEAGTAEEKKDTSDESRDDSSKSGTSVSTEKVTEKARPDAGSPEKTEGSGKEADREYFTTSIRNGETVSDSTYFFTITHLADDLTLVRCDVELNGAVLTGYAGRCTLREGANSIRVSCTYKDTENKVIRAYRDYTVNLKSKEHAIVTDLTDCTVYEPQFSFTAQCEDGLEVRLNGETVSGDGYYTVELRDGENMIRLSSGKKELNFSINYIHMEELGIMTDLSDCTVFEDSISFTAMAVGGRSPKLSVQLNGKTLRGSDGYYTASLSEGANSIRLLARDGSEISEQTFTVTYLPSDSGRLPYIADINLTDNMTVKGSAYTLAIRAEDCDGARIYSGHIEVACGGISCEKRWEDVSASGYILKLSQGENSVYIKLTDSLGRQSEFFYTVNCESAEAGEEVGRVSICVRADVIGLDVLCEDSSYPVLEGETGFDTVVRFLEDNGYTVAYRGSDNSKYLQRISMTGRFAGCELTEEAHAYLENAGIGTNDKRSDDGLGEFDYTAGSGWIYIRDGRRPSYAMSAAVFADGESVELRFSLDLGNDIGSDTT